MRKSVHLVGHSHVYEHRMSTLQKISLGALENAVRSTNTRGKKKWIQSFSWKTWDKTLLWKSRHRLEYDITMNVKGMCVCEDVHDVTVALWRGFQGQVIFLCSETSRSVTQWLSWLTHSATSRKVAGSIPHGIIRVSQWHNPSGRKIALGFTQPLTETSTANISWR